MSGFIEAQVTSVKHWNDTLFSFRTNRETSFRFKNGHFIMMGLPQEKRPLSAPTVLPAPITRMSWNFSALRSPMAR